MRARVAVPLGALVAVLLAAAAGAAYVRATRLSARVTPGRVETVMARAVRRLAVPAELRALRNPVAPSAAGLAEGMAHFADHCAVCHAGDGSGNTEMGRGLYPPAPDMRLAATQQLSDGELFSIIENGIRFTGMPGWSTGTKEGADSSWQLVHFIRHLPRLTEEETERMQSLTPRSPEEVRQDIEEEKFLRGERQ